MLLSAAVVAGVIAPSAGLVHAAPVTPRDSAVATVTVGQSPQSLVVDDSGTYAYVATFQNYQVLKIRLSDFTIDDSMTLPSDPGGTPYAGARAVALYGSDVYVTTSSRLYKMSATNLPSAPDDSVAIPAFGQFLEIDWPNAYVTHHDGCGNCVSKIDLTTMTLTASIASGGTYPMGLGLDDTYAYVVNTVSSTLTRIRLSDFTVQGSLVVGQQPYGVAVDDAGTYAYVPTASDSSWGVTNPPWLVRVDLSTFTVDDTVALPFTWGFGVDVDPAGTAAYVTQSRGGNLVAKVTLGPQMSLAETIAVGPGPQVVTVNPVQPYFYTADANDANGTTLTKVSIVPAVAAPTVTALSPSAGPLAGGGQVLVSGTHLSGATSVRFGVTSATILSGSDDTVLVTAPAAGAAGAQQLTVTTAGGTSTQNVLYTYAAAPSPTSMTPSSGQSGTTVTIVGTALSGSTVTMGGTATTVTYNDDTTIVLTAPDLPAGAANVTVTTAGGSASAGTFTTTETPFPAAPPGMVRDVTVLPLDRAAVVSWQPPADSGSFAVSTYQVQARPGGFTCLTTGLTCTVTGLTNGLEYSFEVRALSGAGWGLWSAPSASVTPDAELVIAGSRVGRRIVITGTARPGDVVQPWVKLTGQGSFMKAAVSVTALADGTFRWTRSARRAATVYVTSAVATSNTVVLPAAR